MRAVTVERVKSEQAANPNPNPSPSPSPSPNPNPNPNPKAVTPITGEQWLLARQMGARGSDVSLITVDATTFLVSRPGGHEELYLEL